MALELLGTSGCHLCEEAEASVEEARIRLSLDFALKLIEIADDPELMESFGLRIPVLRWKEQLLCWPFTTDGVTEFLSAIYADPHHSKTSENRS
ncbi:MAG: hypothetical protein RLZZ627_391 [Pseudomonadota bacterium]|jgi:hypothetical protein